MQKYITLYMFDVYYKFRMLTLFSLPDGVRTKPGAIFLPILLTLSVRTPPNERSFT